MNRPSLLVVLIVCVFALVLASACRGERPAPTSAKAVPSSEAVTTMADAAATRDGGASDAQSGPIAASVEDAATDAAAGDAGASSCVARVMRKIASPGVICAEHFASCAKPMLCKCTRSAAKLSAGTGSFIAAEVVETYNKEGVSGVTTVHVLAVQTTDAWFAAAESPKTEGVYGGMESITIPKLRAPKLARSTIDGAATDAVVLTSEVWLTQTPKHPTSPKYSGIPSRTSDLVLACSIGSGGAPSCFGPDETQLAGTKLTVIQHPGGGACKSLSFP